MIKLKRSKLAIITAWQGRWARNSDNLSKELSVTILLYTPLKLSNKNTIDEYRDIILIQF